MGSDLFSGLFILKESDDDDDDDDDSSDAPALVRFKRENLLNAQARLLPSKTTLHQSFPNPFNPETWIPYQLAENAQVTVQIYDAKGRLIRTLPLGLKPAGVLPKHVLDVACGSGIVCLRAAAIVGEAGRAIGIDLSPGQIRVATQKASAKGYHWVEFIVMNAMHLTFPQALKSLS